MSAYAVLHVEPLHQCAEFDKEGAHNFREYQPKNADPSRAHLNQILYGPTSGLAAQVKERYGALDATLRKDARRGASMILSATRDAFLGPDGQISAERVETFKVLVMSFLRQKYDLALLSIVLHMDERTPHIHAVLIPRQANGKPGYKETFGSKALLKDLQDDFATAMAPLGVIRGKFNSRASHEEVDRYYKRLADIEASIPPLEELGTLEGREQAMTVIVQAQEEAQALREEREAFLARISAQNAEMERLRAENARVVENWQGNYRAAVSWMNAAQKLGNLVYEIRDQAGLDRAVGFVDAHIFPPAEEEAQTPAQADQGGGPTQA